MKKKSESSFDDMYKYCDQFGITPEVVNHHIDEFRRLGLIDEWIDEDGFYNLTANEDIPLERALMILNLGDD